MINTLAGKSVRRSLPGATNKRLTDKLYYDVSYSLTRYTESITDKGIF